MLALSLSGLTFGQWAILVVVVIAVIAIFLAYVRHSGVTIPPFFVNVFWIVIAAVVAVIGIKLVLSLLW